MAKNLRDRLRRQLHPIVVSVFAAFFSGAHSDALEGRWSIRAREHFEVHKYRLADGTDLQYRGLTNTINVWFEKPFAYSFGIAAGPVLGSAKSDDRDAPNTLGRTIRLWTLGLEGKYFPSRSYKGFVRPGVSRNLLQTYGPSPDLPGWGLYLGFGWEFPIGRVSLAPELAVRWLEFDRGVSAAIVTPSIGVHFYNFP